MRHRSVSNKLKSGQHSTYINGLLAALAVFGGWNEVETIVPGIITSEGGYTRFLIKVQYETNTGLKCIAMGTDGVQEIFIVTKAKTAVSERIRTLYPLPEKPKPKAKKIKAEPPKPPLTLCGVYAFGKCRICILCKRCANHQSALTRCKVCK